MSAAETLLSGPRGRALCWAVLLRGAAGADRLRDRAESGDPSGTRGELPARVAAMDLAALAAAAGEFAFFAEVADVVTCAVYWQRPFDAAVDRVLAAGDVREALSPVAEAIAAAPGTRWWASPVAVDGQRYVQFLDAHALPAPRLSGASGLLRTWRADTVADERAARDRPGDPSAPYSGHWWSAPALSGLPLTTRALPVGDAHTMLADWDPDATYWLTDVLSPAGPPTGWAAGDGDGPGWHPASEQELSVCSRLAVAEKTPNDEMASR